MKTKRLNILIDMLIEVMGYKRYELEIVELYGIYFITLPTYSIKATDLIKLENILPKKASIGIYSNIFSGLSIRTEIKK